MAVKKFDEPMTIEKVKKLDNLGILFKRNLNNPPLKDTVRIPRYGGAVLRFVANNPGKQTFIKIVQIYWCLF